MTVAGGPRIRLIQAGGRAGAINGDASGGNLGDRGERRGDGRGAATGAEAGARSIRTMRLPTVVCVLAATCLLLHVVAVRAVLGARQRRRLDENDADPEGPEAGNQS